jgi:hypothetical protein
MAAEQGGLTMKELSLSVGGAVMVLALAGCGAADTVVDALVNDGITVILQNASDDYEVQVELYYDDFQDVPESVLTSLGRRRDYTISPGAAITFTEECDDLQAIIIDDADLVVIGSIGPETSTDVLRDGTHFGCNDTLTFTFDHSELVVDFDVTFTAG